MKVLLVSILLVVFGGNPKEQQRKEVHEYWAQFGIYHVTEVSIYDYLNSDGVHILWEDKIKQNRYRVSWDHSEQSILIEKNGEILEDMIMDEDEAFRPTFEADFSGGSAQFSGFIDFDEENSWFILQIGISTMPTFRVISSPIGVINRIAPNRLADCVCFGLGAGAKCTDDGCDRGVSCGRNRACRWAAGAGGGPK